MYQNCTKINLRRGILKMYIMKKSWERTPQHSPSPPFPHISIGAMEPSVSLPGSTTIYISVMVGGVLWECGSVIYEAPLYNV